VKPPAFYGLKVHALVVNWDSLEAAAGTEMDRVEDTENYGDTVEIQHHYDGCRE
jgi:hypothetical protein